MQVLFWNTSVFHAPGKKTKALKPATSIQSDAYPHTCTQSLAWLDKSKIRLSYRLMYYYIPMTDPELHIFDKNSWVRCIGNFSHNILAIPTAVQLSTHFTFWGGRSCSNIEVTNSHSGFRTYLSCMGPESSIWRSGDASLCLFSALSLTRLQWFKIHPNINTAWF